MGCDIHAIGQVKVDGKWKTVSSSVTAEDRSYITFAILAGVRNYGNKVTPISEPRGLPKDIELKDDDGFGPYAIVPEYACIIPDSGVSTTKWLGDHSYSYLTLKEIRSYYRTYDDRGIVQEYVDFLEALAEEYQVPLAANVRMVFGFDS